LQQLSPRRTSMSSAISPATPLLFCGLKTSHATPSYFIPKNQGPDQGFELGGSTKHGPNAAMMGKTP
jgi:hypothetical protein